MAATLAGAEFFLFLANFPLAAGANFPEPASSTTGSAGASACEAACTGSGAGGSDGAGCAAAAGVTGAATGAGTRPSSSVFSDRERQYTAMPTIRMSATAPESEYINSCGGILLISLRAFSATSRGWILGFSGSVWRRMIDGNGSSASGDSLLGAGGGTYTSLRGGNSFISEKLTPLLAAPAFSAIIGSTAILGVCGSSRVAADRFALGLSKASTEAFVTEVPNWAPGSRCGVRPAGEDPAEFQPAAAAAAFFDGSAGLEVALAGADGVHEVSSSCESEGETSSGRDSSIFCSNFAGALGSMGAEVANFAAAAFFTLAGTAGPLGVSGALLAGLTVLSRAFSRSFTISRPLW